MAGYFDSITRPALTHSPTLMKLARMAVEANRGRLAEEFEKDAIVPGDGGMGMPPGGAPPGGAPPGMPPGGDPSAAGGAAPPPDPAAGGGLDPVAQQVIQAIMPIIQGQGGPGGKGAGGGKKAEQAIMDAKLYAMDMKISLICEKLGIQLPATATLGTPPDPNTSQMAAQDNAAANPVPSMGDVAGASADPAAQGGAPAGGAAPAGGGGAVPPMQGVQPMDPSQGPIGKQSQYVGFGVEYRPSSLLDAISAAPAPPSGVDRVRARLGGGLR